MSYEINPAATLEEMDWEQRFWVCWQALVEMETKYEAHHVMPESFVISPDHYEFLEYKRLGMNYKAKANDYRKRLKLLRDSEADGPVPSKMIG